MADAQSYRPALLIIDFQEDFCPPNGSLAVPNGRDIGPAVNTLLALPFVLKIATQDWHPANHISFASQHTPPNNQPFTSFASILNPLHPAEIQSSRLWPDHCIQDTPGAALVPELHAHMLDAVVKKGMDSRVEMYSAFRDAYREARVVDSGLTAMLKDAMVTDVFVVGLALDYCVMESAVHAAADGFRVFVVREGVNGVDEGEESLEKVRQRFEKAGVGLVGIDGEEVAKVRRREKE